MWAWLSLYKQGEIALLIAALAASCHAASGPSPLANFRSEFPEVGKDILMLPLLSLRAGLRQSRRFVCTQSPSSESLRSEARRGGGLKTNVCVMQRALWRIVAMPMRCISVNQINMV